MVFYVGLNPLPLPFDLFFSNIYIFRNFECFIHVYTNEILYEVYIMFESNIEKMLVIFWGLNFDQIKLSYIIHTGKNIF